MKNQNKSNSPVDSSKVRRIEARMRRAERDIVKLTAYIIEIRELLAKK